MDWIPDASPNVASNESARPDQIILSPILSAVLAQEPGSQALIAITFDPFVLTSQLRLYLQVSPDKTFGYLSSEIPLTNWQAGNITASMKLPMKTILYARLAAKDLDGTVLATGGRLPIDDRRDQR